VDDSDFFRYILESITGIVTGSDSLSNTKDYKVRKLFISENKSHKMHYFLKKY